MDWDSGQVLIAMIVYMAMMVFVGVYYMKKNQSAEDFFLGGRRIGPWVCAMSAEASDMSSWLLMGLPGVAYISGAGEAFWTGLGLALGTYLNWLFVAKRLRNYSRIAGDAITVPEFFSNRFHDKKRILTLVSGVIILFFFVIYTASGFSACGTLFATLFQADYKLMMIISAVVVVLYTLIGGFLSDTMTDLIQAILMVFALVIVLTVGLGSIGGIQGLTEAGGAIEGYFDVMGVNNHATGRFEPYSLLTIASTLAWGLGYFGMPHVLVRFMAIKEASQLKRSRRIATVWVVVSMSAAILIGWLARAKFGTALFPTAESVSSHETAFILLSRTLMPPILAGIMLSGILACTMSTADSQLLVASSTLSNDFYKNLFHKKTGDKSVLRIGQATVVLVAVIGALLALDNSSTIFGLVKYAWAGFGAAFGPVMLFSLFWKRTTLAGAVAGMATGGATVVIWREFISRLGGVFAIYELLPAFVLASVVILAVSLCTKKPSEAIQSEFEAAKAA